MTENGEHVHVPVLLREVMQYLECRPGGAYVDATAGGGGYTRAMLEASEPGGRVLALDWDSEAVSRLRAGMMGIGDRVRIEKGGVHELSDVLQWLGWGPVDGVVLDLGVSSFQLQDPERGFSFLHDGPLDMRMNRDAPLTAADLVNGLSEEELARLFLELGEERWAARVARAVVKRRRIRPIERTMDLADIIAWALPRTRERFRIHPATRCFLALRLAVNRELDSLRNFLEIALDCINRGGRLVIVSFHSLEDRLVKRAFRHWAKSCRCPKEIPVCRCEGRPLVRLLTKHVVRPSAEEVTMNPRARSARLRAVVKV